MNETQTTSKNYLPVFIAGLIALILCCVGLISLKGSALLNQDVERLQQLPVFSATVLGDSRPGQEGFIEGRISERNPLQARSFVAYYRESYLGEQCETDDEGHQSCESIWRGEERITPPLWLDLPDGRVQIVNSNYDLRYGLVMWQSTPKLEAQITNRYYGFEIGSPAFARGQVVMNGQDQAFQAMFVYGGDSASYIAGKHSQAGINYGCGVILIMMAGGCGLFALRRLVTTLTTRPVAAGKN